MILLAVGWLLKNLLSNPAQGTVQTKTPTASVASRKKVTYIELKGKTFTLSYPSSFSLAPLGNGASYGDLDNFLLNTSSIAGSDHLAVAVQARFTNINENSSYRFRQLRPELYTQTKAQVGGSEAIIMTKTQEGYEQTVFIPRHDKLATIAFTSPQADADEHGAVMDHIMSTFRWN